MDKYFVQMQQLAGNGGAMEAETIQKNAARPKSRTGRINLILLTCISVAFASCKSPCVTKTVKIYTKPGVASYTAQHKTLAILPPKIRMEASKNESDESMQTRRKNLTATAQNTMFNNFNKWAHVSQWGKQTDHINVEVQDVETTNRLLATGGCPNGDCELPFEQLASALGVDAILRAEASITGMENRNMATGIISAASSSSMSGRASGMNRAFSKTALGTVDLKLYDGKSGALLWSYSDKYEFGKEHEDEVFMVECMVKNMPYYK